MKIPYTLGLILLVGFVQAQTNPEPYATEIKSADLKKHLYILASDSLEGRETGAPGQKKAAQYIKEHFKSLGIPGISGLSGEGYYQEFPLTVKTPGTSFVNIGSDSIYNFNVDFFHFSNFLDGLYAADEVLFLNYGIGHTDYNSFSEVDALNKILVVFEGLPEKIAKPEKQHGKSGVEKSRLAAQKGAKAILVILDDFESKRTQAEHKITKSHYKLSSDTSAQTTIPTLYISTQMAQHLFENSNYTLEKLKRKSAKKPFSISLKTSIEIAIKSQKNSVSSENVLGYIEGTDKKDELIILTAHYDHLGVKDGKIYYGADDDGSGTAALLDIAESFMLAKKQGNGPRRSILIMPVSGEEKGLLGSDFYTTFPVFPLENTVANLNIDMIGRLDSVHQTGDYIYLIGSDKLSSELHQISEKNNDEFTKLKLDYTYNVEDEPNRFYYRSDHYNFAKNNIPVIFYFNGVHADYHKETDTVDKIDFEKMEPITRLVFYTAWELANREARIVVDSNKQ